MADRFPPFVRKILSTLTQAGFEAYVVGGAVRDLLMDKEVKDWDFTTNATPEQIQSLFQTTFYENEFGTVGIPYRDHIYEITTFRTERGYKDRRHPEHVTWGKTLQEDLQRRDFTINAMAFDLKGDIVDPYQGQKDLHQKLIRAVGVPTERFQEDALRLMRAIRIATELAFTIEETTFQAIKENAHLINEIAKERVRDELIKIVRTRHAADGFLFLYNTGLLEHIIPEIIKGYGLEQSGHHTTDVWTHSLMSLKYCPSKDPVIRFATFLHDIGKPVTARGEGKEVTFHNHEVVGNTLVRQIMERLRFPKKDVEKAALLVRWHMFTVDEHITDAAVRRFIRRVGKENINDIMDLRIGDRLGGGCKNATSWRLRKFQRRILEVQETPLSVKDLKIDGNDVMKILKMHPGPKVGKILQELFEEITDDSSKNTKEYLTKRVRELGSS